MKELVVLRLNVLPKRITIKKTKKKKKAQRYKRTLHKT